MKKFLFLFSLILCSCNGSSLLDQPFNKVEFSKDFNTLVKSKELNREQVFLLQYALLRKNDRLNYSIEDITYREIIDLAKTFQEHGIPVEEKFVENGKQTVFETTILNEGAGLIRKGQSSKLKKILKFNALFTNTSKKDVVLLSSTFLVKGPFKKHLTSAGYEINCIVKAGESITVNCLLDAVNIKNNLLHNSQYDPKSLMLDDLLSRIELTLGGVSIEKNTKHFEACGMGNNARRTPFRMYDYTKDFKANQVATSSNSINLGDMHFIVEESDEPIEMFSR